MLGEVELSKFSPDVLLADGGDVDATEEAAALNNEDDSLEVIAAEPCADDELERLAADDTAAALMCVEVPLPMAVFIDEN